MDVLVETRRGRVRGLAEGGLAVFRGIPYARPPIGARRFGPPEPVERWPGTHDASRFGPSASQNGALIGPIMSLGIGRTSEDCLYLNVWTPAADRRRRPVLVWIHGGAFVLGAGSQMLYDGATLARRGDVVVVTINYRLGAFGFLRLRDVSGSGCPPPATRACSIRSPRSRGCETRSRPSAAIRRRSRSSASRPAP